MTRPTDTPDDAVTLGRALRALRRRAGLTQAELAARSATDDTYVSRVEQGRIDVRWRTLARLLRGLKVSARQFGAEVDRQDTPPEP